ncbi:MAG: hypothetical protein ACYCU0_07570 [Solirubrobacteraceae bacterium]
MPTQDGMSQVSRPFQIALAGVLLFAVAWFAVLRQHASTSSTPGPTPSASALSTSKPPSAAEQAAAAAKPSHVYKGSAPGVEGLTRDVRRAHEAVGKSEANAHKLEAASAAVGSQAGAATSTHPSSSKAASGGTAGNAAGHSGGASSPVTPPGSPANRVAAQLKEGRTVLLLFWNPRSSIDMTVREQVSDVSHSLGRAVAVNYAKANEVGAFGTVTRDVVVNETPTLLVIARNGLVAPIVGLTDAFAIEQAIREARVR